VKAKPAVAKTESALMADQLHRAFYGVAWHGPAVMELLADVNAVTAAARSVPGAHSIWELVLHAEVWDAAMLRRLEGDRFQPTGVDNFPLVPPKPTQVAWRKTVARLRLTHDLLVRTVAGLDGARLEERVPGKRYNFRFMLHGVVQHELYHAGQIAILKKARGKE
jgi:hypothetical protein